MNIKATEKKRIKHSGQQMVNLEQGKNNTKINTDGVQLLHFANFRNRAPLFL